MIRTVVVDDEPLARSRIVELLAEDQQIRVTGEARNGNEALKLIRLQKPDLVFLDIQMPDHDGFTVLATLEPDNTPVVIFVTAYDQFAIRAFETNAIDYLLKPFDNQRFSRALTIAKEQIRLKQFSKLSQGLMDLIKSYQWEQQTHPQTIPIKQNGLIEEVPVDQIRVIESHGNYVKLHLEKRWYLYRSTISHLAEKLQKFDFLRIHRSLMVNTNFVKKVSYLQNNEFCFIMSDDKVYNSSRSYKAAISAFTLEKSN